MQNEEPVTFQTFLSELRSDHFDRSSSPIIFDIKSWRNRLGFDVVTFTGGNIWSDESQSKEVLLVSSDDLNILDETIRDAFYRNTDPYVKYSLEIFLDEDYVDLYIGGGFISRHEI